MCVFYLFCKKKRLRASGTPEWSHSHGSHSPGARPGDSSQAPHLAGRHAGSDGQSAALCQATTPEGQAGHHLPPERHTTARDILPTRPGETRPRTSHRDIASNNSRKLQQLGTQVTINIDTAHTPQRLQHEAEAAARSGDLTERKCASPGAPYMPSHSGMSLGWGWCPARCTAGPRRAPPGGTPPRTYGLAPPRRRSALRAHAGTT